MYIYIHNICSVLVGIFSLNHFIENKKGNGNGCTIYIFFITIFVTRTNPLWCQIILGVLSFLKE